MTNLNDAQKHIVLYSQGIYRKNDTFMDIMLIVGSFNENYRQENELLPKQTYNEVLGVFSKYASDEIKTGLLENLFMPENFISMASMTERMLFEIAKIDITVDISPDSNILHIK